MSVKIVEFENGKLSYNIFENQKKLEDVPVRRKDKNKDASVEEYISSLASKLPAPGGGAAAAFFGAQGYALMSMVCNFTIGKQKFLEFEQRLVEIRDNAQINASRMLDLMDLDEENFLPLSRAYSLSENTDEEKKIKEETMEKALVNACIVPIETMKSAYDGLCILEELMKISSKLLVSDVGVSADGFKSAINSARLNVLINLRLMKNLETRKEIEKFIEEVILNYEEKYNTIMQYVLVALS